MCMYIQIYIYHVPSLDDTSEGERQRRLTQNPDICRYIDIYHVPSLDDTSEGERQRRPAQNRKVDKASSYILLYIHIHQCSYMYVYADICRYIDIYHVPSLDDTSEGGRQAASHAKPKSR